MFPPEDDIDIIKGFRKLANAVVLTAVTDACQNVHKINVRTPDLITCRRSLTYPSPIMTFWLELAGLNPHKVYAWGKKNSETGWPIITRKKSSVITSLAKL